MSIIVGIDPSTKTGMARLDTESLAYDCRLIQFKDKTGLPRLQLIAHCCSSVMEDWKPDLVAIEGYAFGNSHSLVTLVEIGTVIRLEALRRGCKIVEVAPTSLKKFVTGKGNAKKPDMAKAAKELFDFSSKSDDIVDAYCLAKYAAHLQSQQLPPTKGVSYHG